jgi:AcrR family transcriptional regulator
MNDSSLHLASELEFSPLAYRRTRQIEERLADKRLRIVKAVRRVVADVGFRDAQISMVAAAADVATGTVYRYFPSKSELFAEALAANSQYELDIVAAVAASGGSPVARLEDAVRVFSSRALKARRIAYAMIAEPVDAEIDTTRLEYRRAFGRLFRQLIDQGVACGELPAQNSEATSACLFGALTEGLIGPLAPGTSRPTQENRLIDTIVAFCLGAVGAHGPSGAKPRPIKGGRP